MATAGTPVLPLAARMVTIQGRCGAPAFVTAVRLPCRELAEAGHPQVGTASEDTAKFMLSGRWQQGCTCEDRSTGRSSEIFGEDNLRNRLSSNLGG